MEVLSSNARESVPINQLEAHQQDENVDSDGAISATRKLFCNEICVDLSYRSMDVIPHLNKPATFLQFLYLQGNNLVELPENFLLNCPVLRRLDLRFNKLTSIPKCVGDHNYLEVLLLQNNKIRELPRELGNSAHLRRLQLLGNPINWPPAEVISRGLDAIMSFLRSERNNGWEVVRKSPTDAICGEEELLVDALNLKERLTMTESQPNQMSVNVKDTSHKIKNKWAKNSSCSEKFCSEVCGQEEETAQVQASLKQKQRKRRQSGHALAIIQGKRFPLGYSKRPCSFTGARIYKALIHQIWVDQLKQILKSQDHVLQKLKDRDALLKWRHETQLIKLQMPQQSWPGLVPPYDFDNAWLKMLTRAGLYKIQNESLEKKCHAKPPIHSIKVGDLEERIGKLIATFENLKTSSKLHETSKAEPGNRCKLLDEEIIKIRKLQQAIQELRLSA